MTPCSRTWTVCCASSASRRSGLCCRTRSWPRILLRCASFDPSQRAGLRVYTPHSACSDCRLRAYVDAVVQQPPAFWHDLTDLVCFLKPFQVATDVIQSDSCTLYDVYQQFRTVLRHVRQVGASSFLHECKDDVVTAIVDRWERHINLDAIVMCALLSFDRVATVMFEDSLNDAREWFLKFATDYAMYWHISKQTERVQVRQEALANLSDFLGRVPIRALTSSRSTSQTFERSTHASSSNSIQGPFGISTSTLLPS